jgi:hypothetical protein
MRELEAVLDDFIMGPDATNADVIGAQNVARMMVTEEEKIRYETIRGATRRGE